MFYYGSGSQSGERDPIGVQNYCHTGEIAVHLFLTKTAGNIWKLMDSGQWFVG